MHSRYTTVKKIMSSLGDGAKLFSSSLTRIVDWCGHAIFPPRNDGFYCSARHWSGRGPAHRSATEASPSLAQILDQLSHEPDSKVVIVLCMPQSPQTKGEEKEEWDIPRPRQTICIH